MSAAAPLSAGDVLRVLAQHPQLRREVHVDTDTVLRIVRAFPKVATAATKYDDADRNAVIATQLGMSVRTVQRARRLLRRLLAAEVIEA